MFRIKTKKFLIFGVSFLLILIFFSFLGINFIQAQEAYKPLAPISSYVPESVLTNNLNNYLNGIFKLGIALAIGLAVVMIIFGGIQYMSTDSWSKKDDGKKRIGAAVLGLIVALGSYMLLNTISPDLLSTDLTLQDLNIGNLSHGPGGGNGGNPGSGKGSPTPDPLRSSLVPYTAPDYPYKPGDPNYGKPAQPREFLDLPPAPKPPPTPTRTPTPRPSGSPTRSPSPSASQSPSPTNDCAQKILEAAQYAASNEHPLNTCNAPDTNGGRVACAYAVNEIVENALGKPINNSLSTTDMNNSLQSSPNFSFIGHDPSQAQPGDIIISPSTYRNGQKITGHVGVCETAGCSTIISNSSNDARVEENYTASKWVNYYQNTRGLPVNIYRPGGQTNGVCS